MMVEPNHTTNDHTKQFPNAPDGTIDDVGGIEATVLDIFKPVHAKVRMLNANATIQECTAILEQPGAERFIREHLRHLQVGREERELFLAEVQRMRRKTPSAEIETGTPETHLPDSPSILAVAFHGLAGQYVKAIAPHTEADPIALLAQFLAYFGNMVGREGAHTRVEASTHYFNLYTVIVGESSKARKGTGRDQIQRIFKSIDADWVKDCIISGLASGEGLIWAVRDDLVTQKNGSDVIESGVQDKRLLVIEAEFARVLSVLGREGNTLSAVLRDGFDTGDLRTTTKNSPARATGAHISIIAHITQGELRRMLTETEAGNGFANRFLWVYAKRAQLLPEGGDIYSVDFAQLNTRLRAAAQFSRGLSKRITRDPDARRLWAVLYGRLSRAEPGLLGAICARAEALVLRLSCLYALLDESPVVREIHLCAAIALWAYCEQSARIIFGDSLGDPLADAIQDVVSRIPEGISRTDLSSRLGRNHSAAKIRQALQALEQQRRITIETRSGDGPGRPTGTIHAKTNTGSKYQLNELNELIRKHLKNKDESSAINLQLITNNFRSDNYSVFNGELIDSDSPNEIKELETNSFNSFFSYRREGGEPGSEPTEPPDAPDCHLALELSAEDAGTSDDGDDGDWEDFELE